MATPKRGNSIHWTLVNWSRRRREGGKEANKAIDGRGNCWQLTLPRLTSLLVPPASQHVYTTLFMCVCVCVLHAQGSTVETGAEAGLRQKSQQAKLQRLNGQNVLLH